jgi:hypothetical protein
MNPSVFGSATLSIAAPLDLARVASATESQTTGAHLMKRNRIQLSRSLLLAPFDGALQAMSVAITLLAAGLLVGRLP